MVKKLTETAISGNISTLISLDKFIGPPRYMRLPAEHRRGIGRRLAGSLR